MLVPQSTMDHAGKICRESGHLLLAAGAGCLIGALATTGYLKATRAAVAGNPPSSCLNSDLVTGQGASKSKCTVKFDPSVEEELFLEQCTRTIQLLGEEKFQNVSGLFQLWELSTLQSAVSSF